MPFHSILYVLICVIIWLMPLCSSSMLSVIDAEMFVLLKTVSPVHSTGQLNKY